MELARLPQGNQTELSAAQVKVLEAMADGKSVRTIAERIGGQDMAKRKAWRNRIRYWMRDDPSFRAALGLAAQAQHLDDLMPATIALGRRAARGRTDAIRLLYEASGYHNPKVQHNHEHSGTIDINLKMGGRPEPVVDAEVVEE
jgi:hypothetical protein